MTIEIVKPGDRRHVKFLVFSPPGHGKTHLLGTAQLDPRTSPMLLLDFEGGDETLAGLDIDMVPVRSWDDYSEAYEILSDKDCKYKSIGIDSASETHVWALLEIIKRKGPSRVAKGADPDLIEQGDYGIGSTQMRRLLREFRDLPLHVFYTATAKEIEERGVGRIKVPALAGQMAEEVVALMSVVGYLATYIEDDEEHRTLVLQGVPGFRTKARTKWDLKPPSEIIDPTVTKILDALEVPHLSQNSNKRRTSTKES